MYVAPLAVVQMKNIELETVSVGTAKLQLDFHQIVRDAYSRANLSTRECPARTLS